MPFNYHRDTREAYKDPIVALDYDRAFSGNLSWKTLRFKIVAGLERRAIDNLLRHTPPGVILDIPCGTGKLAEILSKRGESIIAADISPEMLAIAKAAYSRAGISNVKFVHGEMENLVRWTNGNEITTTVCLRLMHRVPRPMRQKMLNDISKITRFAVISFAVDSHYHRLRRRLRTFAFGAKQQEICAATIESITEDLTNLFEVQKVNWIGRLVSEEMLVLLKTKSA